MSTQIRGRERDAVIQSLRAGVVPRVGQHLIQVGRSGEIGALVSDIDRISNGGSSFRLVIGDYGAGKTFFLNLIRSIAFEKKLVVANADLNPDRRLQASGGQARALYAELMRNLASRTKQDGGALSGIVEKFIGDIAADAKEKGISKENLDSHIRKQLEPLTEMVNGFDFVEVIIAYWRGFSTGDDKLKSDAVRWLRGEFSTKTDARSALNVRAIVDDADVYDQLKLMSQFVRMAGYGGLMICLDEMVNLYKLANTQARNSNYEQILRILNDSFQGVSVGLGVILGGTPEFLMDTRRGLYSYSALQSRLAQNQFAADGRIDLSGPVVKLSSLTPEDLYVLLEKVRHVFANGEPSAYLIPDEGIYAFMHHCADRIGDKFFRTPRTTITSFIDLLAVLEQNRDTSWRELVGTSVVIADNGGETDLQVESDDELASFKI